MTRTVLLALSFLGLVVAPDASAGGVSLAGTRWGSEDGTLIVTFHEFGAATVNTADGLRVTGRWQVADGRATFLYTATNGYRFALTSAIDPASGRLACSLANTRGQQMAFFADPLPPIRQVLP